MCTAYGADQWRWAAKESGEGFEYSVDEVYLTVLLSSDKLDQAPPLDDRFVPCFRTFVFYNDRCFLSFLRCIASSGGSRYSLYGLHSH